jgi:RNA-directed DNA polymerase
VAGRPSKLMGGEQQKNQMELAFTVSRRGEASQDTGQGTEPPVAKPETGSRTPGLMEEICETENVKAAFRRVKGNRGSPGIDGMSVEQLHGHLGKHWPEIREALVKGAYRPKPVKRVEIPKTDGGVRKLGIPTALDRFVQQAVMQVLQNRWDPTFSDHSYGFRPNRSAHQAVAAAQGHVAEGYEWVVDIDLEKFFDRVNHDRLMSQLAKRIEDKRVLKLIREFLNAGVMENGLVSPTTEGTPQGGPLSPLLSNIVLDELDRELQRRGHRFVRYADDCNIYVRSERAGHRVMEGVRKFITKKLKLKVNEQKSKVAKTEDRKFLGFRLKKIKGEVRRTISPQSIDRFKRKIRELTRRVRGVSILQILAELNAYLRGWYGYYGFAQDAWTLKRLDQWIRRRLRSLIWTQWKTAKQRYQQLRSLGVKARDAREFAGSSKGPWTLSASPILHAALSNAHLHKTLGLVSITPSPTG